MAFGPSATPPKPDMAQIISVFGMQALMACGKIPNPMNNKYSVDLPMAQYHIGILDILKAKTAGNLNADEEKTLDEFIHQAHMAFVDASRQSGGFA